MYFFYQFITIWARELGLFEIRINDVRMCSAYGDMNDSTTWDYPAASCGVVASLTAGNHQGVQRR